MKNKNLYNFVLSFGLTFLVAGLGSIFVQIGMNNFTNLIKPNEWIPNFIIPIIWTIIYVISAVIIYMLLSKNLMTKKLSWLFGLNGLLNVIWCLVFFALGQKFLGLITIIINLILGFLLIIELLKNQKIYGWILFIYPIWLCIATFLNCALWILN